MCLLSSCISGNSLFSFSFDRPLAEKKNAMQNSLTADNLDEYREVMEKVCLDNRIKACADYVQGKGLFECTSGLCGPQVIRVKASL